MYENISSCYIVGSEMKGNFSFSFHTFHKISTAFIPAAKVTFHNLHGPRPGVRERPLHQAMLRRQGLKDMQTFLASRPLILQAVQNLCFFNSQMLAHPSVLDILRLMKTQNVSES